jgi:hypothetical protein
MQSGRLLELPLGCLVCLADNAHGSGDYGRYVSSDAQMILTGEAQTGKGGYCYKFFSGDSFDGSNIPARWITKVLYGSDGETNLMAYLKRWRWLDLIAEADTDVTLTIEWMSGNSSDDAVSDGAGSRAWPLLGCS